MWITLEKCVTVAVTMAVVIAKDYVITPHPPPAYPPAGPQLGLSRGERLTLCSTILLHGEGPVPNLTAEETWPCL